MIQPAMCRVAHDEELGTYGDCVRACVATLIGIPDADVVPHFFQDGNAENGTARLRVWLRGRDLVPFFVHFGGDALLAEVLQVQSEMNPDVHYILVCATRHGDHAVVACGGNIVHDPSWVRSDIIGPASNKMWSIMVIVAA